MLAFILCHSFVTENGLLEPNHRILFLNQQFLIVSICIIATRGNYKQLSKLESGVCPRNLHYYQLTWMADMHIMFNETVFSIVLNSSLKRSLPSSIHSKLSQLPGDCKSLDSQNSSHSLHIAQGYQYHDLYTLTLKNKITDNLHSSPECGLFIQFPNKCKADFGLSFPDIIDSIKITLSSCEFQEKQPQKTLCMHLERRVLWLGLISP